MFIKINYQFFLNYLNYIFFS